MQRAGDEPMCRSQQQLTMYVFLLLHYSRREGVIVQWI